MRKAALLLLCLLLSGCLPTTQPTAVMTGTAPAEVTATAAPALSPTAPATPRVTVATANVARTLYRIDATLDPSLRGLSVLEGILFSNPTGAPLEALPLAVEANLFEGAFELLGISAASGYAVSIEALEGNRLTVSLHPGLPAGESLELTLEYRLNLPPISPDKPQVFGYTQKQLNLVDWYPYLPPYDGQSGWLVHPPAGVGEHTVNPGADFDVALHLPQLTPALVVAASAAAEPIPDGYRYHVAAARNFTWSASQEYVVSSQQAGSVTVASYAYPATELAARAALDYTAQALLYFSKQFAAEPRGFLSIVQADFPDGMEYDGLYFLSERFYYGFDGSPRSYLALIAVHETAHQWWYALVGSDQALEPWLDEGLCVYSELLFYEDLAPELADWWWRFRVEPNAPEGSLDATIYDFAQFTPYRNRVYLRGAQFLDEIRHTLGDDAFIAALQGYAERFAGQIATGEDLLTIFQQASAADLTPLRLQYFER